MFRTRFLVLSTLLLLCLGSASLTKADPVTGQLNISEPAAGGVTVNNTTIDFFAPVGGTTGTFNVGASSGTFAPLSGTSGTIKDLPSNLVGAVPEPYRTGFLTFAGNPGLRFDLTFIYPGFAGVNGTTPFFLSQVGPNVSVAASFDGNFVLGGDATPYTGIFTTQLPNTTVAAVVAGFNAGQSFTSTYSASLTLVPQAIPEPATMVLLGTGLAGLAGAARRRKKANKE